MISFTRLPSSLIKMINKSRKQEIVFDQGGPMVLSKPATAIRKSVEEKNLESYFREIKFHQKLSSEEERLLAARIKLGDQSALNKLVEANLKFVIAVCKNYRNQGLSFNDLIGEGNLGLIKAAKRFDGETGNRFITYAVWWIRQGILIALADQGRIMNIAPGRIRTISKMNKATRELSQRLNREPTSEELAIELGVSDELITECRVLTLPTKSLSRYSMDDDQHPEDFLEDKSADAPDKSVTEYLIEKKIELILKGLGNRKASVLRLSYGLGGGTAYNLKEISEKFNLSKERIRQIKQLSLTLLQNQVQKNYALI